MYVADGHPAVKKDGVFKMKLGAILEHLLYVAHASIDDDVASRKTTIPFALEHFHVNTFHFPLSSYSLPSLLRPLSSLGNYSMLREGILPQVEVAVRRAVVPDAAAGPVRRVDDGDKAELSACGALGA